MGFELDKLMKQYGVSTPTVATYTGTAAPTELTSTATQADKDAFAEQARKYNLDQNAYNQYKQQYQDRMQTGSQYGPPTTAAKIVNPTYGAVGLNVQGMSDADRQAYYNSQRKLGYTMGDLKANAEKTFGVGSVADPNWNGWEGQYNPDYVPPAGPIVATGSAPPVTTTAGATDATNTAGGSYAGQYFDPNDPNSPYYQGYAQGGSIHALAAKYRNGGPVKRHYDDGGNVDFGNDNPANLPTMASPVAGVPSMDAIAAATRAAPMPQVAPVAVDPNAMLASAVRSRTLPETTKAFSDYDAAQKAVMDSLRQQGAEKISNGPSKAETYFKLAAAFAEPGKTGSFGEGLGRAAGVMGDYQKAARESDIANAMAKRSLQTEMLKYQAQSAEKALEQRVKVQDKLNDNSQQSPEMRLWLETNAGNPNPQSFPDFVKSRRSQTEQEAFDNASPDEQKRMLENWTKIALAKNVVLRDKQDLRTAAELKSAQGLSDSEKQARNAQAFNYLLKGSLPYRKGDPRNDEVMAAVVNIGNDLGKTPQELAAMPASYKADAASLSTNRQKLDTQSSALEAFHNNFDTWDQLASNTPLTFGDTDAKAFAASMNEINQLGITDIDQAKMTIASHFNDPRAIAVAAAAYTTALDFARISSPASNAALTEGATKEAVKLMNAAFDEQGRKGLRTAMYADADGKVSAQQHTINNILDRLAGRPEGTTNKKEAESKKSATTSLPAGIPAGSIKIGKTPDGKDVYKDPNGKQLVIQ